MNKIGKITLISLTSIVGVSALAICVMGSIHYSADEIAISEANKNNVSNDYGDYYVKSENNNGSLVIFYPGAMVESKSYVPLAQKLAVYNIDTYIVTMPFNFAFFNSSGADFVISNYKNYSSYYIMGHSLGGSMASNYANKNSDKIDGLILLGAYPYKDYPLEKTCTIYGSLNVNVKERIDYTINVTEIEGGNHCYFGNYGQQLGDPVGEISREAQQDITASAINDFINK